VGAGVQLYPQTDVFIDLADARARDGGDVRFGVSDVSVVDVTTDRPGIVFVDDAGAAQEVRCDFLVGSDGSRSICRHEFPEAQRRQFVQVQQHGEDPVPETMLPRPQPPVHHRAFEDS